MEIEKIKTHLELAHSMVRDLCHGKREWIMSIPANPSYDPDLIIGQALRDGDRMVEEIARLEAEIKGLREGFSHIINIGHNLDCIFCGFKDKKATSLLDRKEGSHELYPL